MTQDRIIHARYAVIPKQDVLNIESEELAASRLPPHSILIEAEATVVSAGTELANFTGLDPGVNVPGSWNAYPWRPGYGLVGRVLAMGDRVTGFAEGDRVFCFGKHASHQIYDARRGVFKLDDNLSSEQAALLRMALVSITGPQITEFEVGDSIAVLGLGLVGNLAAQLYQFGGARVIALDTIASRCDLARQVGIKTVLHVQPQDQVQAILDLTGGKGASVTVDAVGHSSVALTCVETCADFGQIILLGSPREPLTTEITETLSSIHHRWLTLRGALEWRLPAYPTTGSKHSSETNFHLLVELAKSGQLIVDPLISHTIEPEGLPETYNGLLHDKGNYWGVIVDWRA